MGVGYWHFIWDLTRLWESSAFVYPLRLMHTDTRDELLVARGIKEVLIKPCSGWGQWSGFLRNPRCFAAVLSSPLGQSNACADWVIQVFHGLPPQPQRNVESSALIP